MQDDVEEKAKGRNSSRVTSINGERDIDEKQERGYVV